MSLAEFFFSSNKVMLSLSIIDIIGFLLEEFFFFFFNKVILEDV